MFHNDLLFARENSKIGIFRPTGWPWNTGIDNANNDYWIDWINTWIQNQTDAIQVDGVLNDCLYRSVHSSHRYSVAVFAFNPYRDFSVSLSYERTFHTIWHNSWNNISISEIEINSYCKGLVFYPSAGAGGGVVDVYKITASLGGRGVLDYEVCMGINNDSNKPTIGSSANSYTANGKLYEFWDG